MCAKCRAQEALEDERAARVEAETMAERMRQQLATLREAQSQQQRSSQERLAALQAHLQSLASRVVCTLAGSLCKAISAQ